MGSDKNGRIQKIMVRVSEIKRDNNESRKLTLFIMKAWDDDDNSDIAIIY